MLRGHTRSIIRADISCFNKLCSQFAHAAHLRFLSSGEDYFYSFSSYSAKRMVLSGRPWSTIRKRMSVLTPIIQNHLCLVMIQSSMSTFFHLKSHAVQHQFLHTSNIYLIRQLQHGHLVEMLYSNTLTV